MNRHVRCRRHRRRRSSGFTLMEVLLVLAILVILGTLVVTNFAGVFAKSKIDVTSTQVSLLETQLELYQMHVGSYPATQQGLESLRQPPSDLADPTKWHGPYAKKDLVPDPWGNAYIYELVTPTQYMIYSAGPDGQPKTEDDIGSVSG